MEPWLCNIAPLTRTESPSITHFSSPKNTKQKKGLTFGAHLRQRKKKEEASGNNKSGRGNQDNQKGGGRGVNTYFFFFFFKKNKHKKFTCKISF
jgi:hypothetical protein